MELSIVRRAFSSMSSSLLLGEKFFVSSMSLDQKDYFPSCQTDHLNAHAFCLKSHFPEQSALVSLLLSSQGNKNRRDLGCI